MAGTAPLCHPARGVTRTIFLSPVTCGRKWGIDAKRAVRATHDACDVLNADFCRRNMLGEQSYDPVMPITLLPYTFAVGLPARTFFYGQLQSGRHRRSRWAFHRR